MATVADLQYKQKMQSENLIHTVMELQYFSDFENVHSSEKYSTLWYQKWNWIVKSELAC